MVSSIQIGLPRTYTKSDADDGEAKTWRTGFYKTSVLFPVQVRRLGIDGDGQANLKYHGGPDLPILAYCAEHYPRWQAELINPAMQAGGFGENLTISSVDGSINETTVCIGDRFSVGEIELEVSQPREPCFKLVRRWNQPDLAKRVLELNRGGWYLRVLREGIIAPGDPVRRIASPFPQWTVAAAMHVMYHARADLAASKMLIGCPALSERWQLQLRKRLTG